VQCSVHESDTVGPSATVPGIAPACDVDFEQGLVDVAQSADSVVSTSKGTAIFMNTDERQSMPPVSFLEYEENSLRLTVAVRAYNSVDRAGGICQGGGCQGDTWRHNTAKVA